MTKAPLQQLRSSFRCFESWKEGIPIYNNTTLSHIASFFESLIACAIHIKGGMGSWDGLPLLIYKSRVLSPPHINTLHAITRTEVEAKTQILIEHERRPILAQNLYPIYAPNSTLTNATRKYIHSLPLGRRWEETKENIICA